MVVVCKLQQSQTFIANFEMLFKIFQDADITYIHETFFGLRSL